MDIVTVKGMMPVHMFDIYGVLLDADKMADKAVQTYRQLADETGVPKETSERIISDYMALVRGEPWTTGSRKTEIIQALQGPLAKAGIKTSYAGCFNEDGVYVAREILDANEGLSLFSSGNNDDMRKDMPEDLAQRVGRFYDVSQFTYPTAQSKRTKSEPAAFVELLEREKATGRHVVSHTADELPELVAALASGTIHPQNLVYVNRNNSNSESMVLSKGIPTYVNDLREVGYTKR
jgi:FMN phosphatase YigB (HAD superfamily)